MSHHDLYAIGNALVDSEYEVSEALLAQAGVEKRHMTLIDGPRRTELLHHLTGLHPRQTGGGSAGNTVVAMAQFGGKSFYSCRVADDELGAFYAQDLLSHGVATNLSHTRAPHGQTGSCLVMVTPDAERSMSTFLGATAELDSSALHPQDIQKSIVYYMEGYLAASPTGLVAALEGRALARQAGVALATTLSDVSMIRFCRDGLEAMVGQGDDADLDYLFCNEEEAQVWCDSADLDQVCARMRALAKVVCITRAAKGCLVLHGGQTLEVPASPIKAVDSNGAGDMFAGAFLYAVTQNHSLAQAAWLANQAAARVVAQHGNRLSASAITELKQAFADHLTTAT
jgi:sugar/nucleoside kinase (ribokinase family)